ncbi:MAG: tyrosine-type recombinase/integrase [Candidatus Lambdaproteobacteria bacterium]|nr:tyrosine-type recombinase/integrase [Candidatus Lambdaproteobacteria bacterium]
MKRLILQFTADLHLKRYSQNSIQNHRLDVLRFQDWLEPQGAADIAGLQGATRDTVLVYQGELARRLKPRSVNRHLSSLKLFFRFLEEAGLLPLNPMDNLTYPKLLPQLPTMLLPGEVGALLEAPNEAHYLGLRDKAMLELLYSSGLKLNELLGLDVGSLQLDAGLVRVSGKRERVVPVTEPAQAVLRRYLDEARPGRLLHPDDPCLFPGRNGRRISRVGVWKMIKKHAAAAGIHKNFNPRTLRHAFAMHLILGGMDLDGIKLLFGYRQLEATAIYAHVNTPDFRDAYRAYHPLTGPPAGPGRV